MDEEESESLVLKKRKSKPKQSEEQRRVANKRKKEKRKVNKRVSKVHEQIAALVDRFSEENEEVELSEIWMILEMKSE